MKNIVEECRCFSAGSNYAAIGVDWIYANAFIQALERTDRQVIDDLLNVTITVSRIAVFGKQYGTAEDSQDVTVVIPEQYDEMYHNQPIRRLIVGEDQRVHLSVRVIGDTFDVYPTESVAMAMAAYNEDHIGGKMFMSVIDLDN